MTLFTLPVAVGSLNAGKCVFFLAGRVFITVRCFYGMAYINLIFFSWNVSGSPL